MNSRNYLATIVVDPRGAEGASNEIIPKLSEAILQSEAEVLKVEEQGKNNFLREATSSSSLRDQLIPPIF
jgi:hypothetical protein